VLPSALYRRSKERLWLEALLSGSTQRRVTVSFSRNGGNDVFVHISAVERAGLSGLAEGQKVSFEMKTDPRRGKTSAENLRV
jgi:cold shock CspA family protein